MRSFILGFAIGTWLLQQQSILPEADRLWSLAALSVAVCAASSLLRRIHGHSTTWRRATALVVVASGIGIGFACAGQQASHRMADELPSAWEGVDIRVQGIVSGLPAINRSDRSVRFAFDIERAI